MQLAEIPYNQLHLSATNTRGGTKRTKKQDALDDLAADLRERGIVQSLLVRAEGDGYAVIAGRRRWLAVGQLLKGGVTAANNGAKLDPLPCGVLEDGDDADALDASLAENIQRLPMSALEQCDVFKRLHDDAGLSVETIAERYGVKSQIVRQRMALADLDAGIRALYEEDEIDDDELRALALATPKQQKDYLALCKKGEAPRGWYIKKWVLGGNEIDPVVALFDTEASGLAVTEDLFGGKRYFTDAEAFWPKQLEAVNAEADKLRTAGWPEVTILEPGEHLRSWEFEKAGKKEGGGVYIEVRPTGEVLQHKGLKRPSAKRRTTAQETEGGGETAPARCELTQRAQDYIAAHRAALVRKALIAYPGTALRLAVGLAIAGNEQWQVKAGKVVLEAATSVAATNQAQAAIDQETTAVLGLLGMDETRGSVLGGPCTWNEHGAARIFAHLQTLDDPQVLQILALVVAESLAAGSGLVELVGGVLNVQAGADWRPDPLFWEVMRDKRVLHGLLSEVMSAPVGPKHQKSTGKVLKETLQTALAERAEPWTPGYLEFPFRPYVCAVGIVMVERLLAFSRPDPLACEADEDPATDDDDPEFKDDPDTE
jgi:ParB family chromosome partitioning protein